MLRLRFLYTHFQTQKKKTNFMKSSKKDHSNQYGTSRGGYSGRGGGHGGGYGNQQGGYNQQQYNKPDYGAW